jgi:beta-mannanase
MSSKIAIIISLSSQIRTSLQTKNLKTRNAIPTNMKKTSNHGKSANAKTNNAMPRVSRARWDER